MVFLILPDDYRKINRLVHRPRAGESERRHIMTPTFVERGEIILVGMDFCGDPYTKAGGWSEENEIGRLWKRFMRFYQENKEHIKNRVSDSGYEVWVETDQLKETKDKYIFVGIEVESIQDLPLDLVVKVLPPTEYAVFTMKGEQIKSNWPDRIYKEWLPQSPYKEAHPFLIEYYDAERFKGMDNAESELDIYLPVNRGNS
jgi:predicted transcriptional regulator YdeE